MLVAFWPDTLSVPALRSIMASTRTTPRHIRGGSAQIGSAKIWPRQSDDRRRRRPPTIGGTAALFGACLEYQGGGGAGSGLSRAVVPIDAAATSYALPRYHRRRSGARLGVWRPLPTAAFVYKPFTWTGQQQQPGRRKSPDCQCADKRAARPRLIGNGVVGTAAKSTVSRRFAIR